MAAIAPAPVAAPSPPAQDPLFSSMVKFVTSGKNARHVSNGKIKELLQATVEQEGGREYLQGLASSVSAGLGEGSLWEFDDPASGVVSLSSTTAAFDILSTTHKIQFTGSAPGFYFEMTQTVFDVDLCFNALEDVSPGLVDFTFRQYGQMLWLNITRTGHGNVVIQINGFQGQTGNLNHRGSGSFSVAK